MLLCYKNVLFLRRLQNIQFIVFKIQSNRGQNKLTKQSQKIYFEIVLMKIITKAIECKETQNNKRR